MHNTFTQAVKTKNTKDIGTSQLEQIADAYPYFSLAKTILLKKYHSSEHFKYNHTLKNVAAHTISRDVLFDFINLLEEEKEQPSNPSVAKTVKNTIFNLKKEVVDHSSTTTLNTETPFKFTSSEKHSFQQWLQLNHQKPIARNTPKAKPLEPKLDIIDQFILNNPKISPVKKTETPKKNLSLKKSDDINTNQLMTETLAKVYIAQKKYNDAIQAYKILSLKYPEKSSFFANQIERIEILQTHKS